MPDKAVADGEDVAAENLDNPGSEPGETEERIAFLEKEYRQLSSLFHNLLSEINDQDKKDAQSSKNKFTDAPVSKIDCISLSAWRALQDRSNAEETYSLLTLLPKRHYDNEAVSQAAIGQSNIIQRPDDAPLGQSITIENDSIGYLAVLNGTVEFMETLGEIINCPSLPGFYLWFWPFKHLICHRERLEVRLSEEETKCAKKEESSSIDDQSRTPNQALPSTKGSDENLKPDKIQQSKSEQPKSKVATPAKRAGQEDAAPPHTSQIDKAANKLAGDQNEGVDSSTTEDMNPRCTEPKVGDESTLRDQLRCLVQFMQYQMASIFAVQKGIDELTRKTIGFDYLWQLYKPGDLIVSKDQPRRAFLVLHVTGGRSLYKRPFTNAVEDPLGETIDRNRYRTPEQLQEREAYLAKYSRSSPFVIDCFFIDFDGNAFGPRPQTFSIAEYPGEVAIDSLEAFPIGFDETPKATTKILLKRGKRFTRLVQADPHKYYSGRTIREPCILETQAEVHGEIIVDFALAIKNFRTSYRWRDDYGNRWDFKFNTGVIANPTPADDREKNGFYNVVPEKSDNWRPTYFMEDTNFDNERRNDFAQQTTLLQERSLTEKLPNEALMLLPPRVYGFSLLDRVWYGFDIDHVKDIKVDPDQGFHNLVLPEEHKQIMQALVQTHSKPSAGMRTSKEGEFSMDLVRGKGKGLVILLHGVPGVGKTSTAECVAAQTKRPLFPLTCGDIGTHARDVEERLTEFFDMAHKWGCVLLLDEADVFLAKRMKGGDIQRNAIVSVFLRVLEYYSGILILTTNRIGEFDEAFSSRVHVKLYYPKLSKNSTLEIWKMNMRRIANSDLDIDVQEHEIKKFVRKLWAESADKQTQRWNGRQIRNAFQTAIALAQWDHQHDLSNAKSRPCITVRHFEVVAQTSAHFDNYISTMYGIEESADTWEAIMAREQLRKNETARRAPAISMPRARGSRQTVPRIEVPGEEDDDGDDTSSDSDSKEAKLKKLRAEIAKIEEEKKPAMKSPKESKAGASQRNEAETSKQEDSTSDSSKSDDEG